MSSIEKSHIYKHNEKQMLLSIDELRYCKLVTIFTHKIISGVVSSRVLVQKCGVGLSCPALLAVVSPRPV